MTTFRLYERLAPGHKYPFRLFGRFICVYPWGIDVRLAQEMFLVIVWKRSHHGGCAFLSPNGTPSHAVRWLWGRGND